MSRILGTKHFVVQLAGEVPPGVSDAQWTAQVAACITVGLPILATVKTTAIAIGEGPLPQPPGEAGPKIA